MLTTTRIRGLIPSSARLSNRLSNLRLLVLAATGAVLLASGYILTGLLPDAPLWNAATRVLPAGLLLLAVHPVCPPAGWWSRSLILGTLNFAAFFAAQAFTLHRIPAGIAATIAATQTLLVPLGATTLLGERLRWHHLTLASLGVTGVALLVLRDTHHIDPLGVATAAALALCTTTGMLLTRRWGLPPGATPTTATAWQILAGGTLLLPAALLLEGPPPALTLTGWAVTAWLALPATALAFTAIFGALHHGLPTTSLSRIMLLSPLLTTIASWLLYHHTLNPPQLLGASLVLTSIAATGYQPTPRAARQTHPPPKAGTTQ